MTVRNSCLKLATGRSFDLQLCPLSDARHLFIYLGRNCLLPETTSGALQVVPDKDTMDIMLEAKDKRPCSSMKEVTKIKKLHTVLVWGLVISPCYAGGKGLSCVCYVSCVPESILSLTGHLQWLIKGQRQGWTTVGIVDVPTTEPADSGQD